LTNTREDLKKIMEQYGSTGLQVDGHSRGSMTIGNAIRSIDKQYGKDKRLTNTSVSYFGPADNEC